MQVNFNFSYLFFLFTTFLQTFQLVFIEGGDVNFLKHGKKVTFSELWIVNLDKTNNMFACQCC
jgi:hypothetical protein